MVAERAFAPASAGASASTSAAIGLAFLFVEIASIQRFTLFLSHPLYAIAVVLAGFLVFAGLGSGLAAGLEQRLRARGGPGALPLAVAAIALLSIAYVFGLPFLFARADGAARCRQDRARRWR